MLVVYRFAVTEGETEAFARDAEGALAALASCAGYERGGLGRALDSFTDGEDTAWMLWTEWSDVGSYRRALSNFQVKMATPLLSRALPEIRQALTPFIETHIDTAMQRIERLALKGVA